MKEMTIIEKKIVRQAQKIIKKLRENGTVKDASNEERMVICIAAKIVKEKNKKELRKEKIKKWFDEIDIKNILICSILSGVLVTLSVRFITKELSEIKLKLRNK